jgi:hypothetical protein
MLSADLVERVTENLEEILVRGEDFAVQVEFDNRLYPVQGLIDGHQVGTIGGFFFYVVHVFRSAAGSAVLAV